jgi:hypothetical protein
MRLKDTVNALARADSQQIIEEIVTTDAATALGLASAVFFRHFDDGGYLRERGFGWAADSLWNLLPDDELVKVVGRGTAAIDLRTLGWRRTQESAPRAPGLVVPMRVGNRVIGMTFYGDRMDGVFPSPDDVRALVDLSQQAANVYAFFESVRYRSATPIAARSRVSL